MSRRGAYGVVLGAVTVMVALVVASSGRAPDLFSRPRTTLEPVGPNLSPEPTLSSGQREPGEAEGVGGWDPSGFLATLVQILVIIIVIAVLALLFLALRDLMRRFGPSLTSRTDPGFDAPQVPRELLEGADAGLEALDEGEPRNAIVAAWVVLESSAAVAGLPRHAYETSAEYVERVLRVWAVDAAALDDLAALYREARFSTHPLTERHRTRAITALGSIRSDLGTAREAGTDSISSSQAGAVDQARGDGNPS